MPTKGYESIGIKTESQFHHLNSNKNQFIDFVIELWHFGRLLPVQCGGETPETTANRKLSPLSPSPGLCGSFNSGDGEKSDESELAKIRRFRPIDFVAAALTCFLSLPPIPNLPLGSWKSLKMLQLLKMGMGKNPRFHRLIATHYCR